MTDHDDHDLWAHLLTQARAENDVLTGPGPGTDEQVETLRAAIDRVVIGDHQILVTREYPSGRVITHTGCMEDAGWLTDTLEWLAEGIPPR